MDRIDKALAVIKSDVPANQIQQCTGINRSQISRIRKGEQLFENLSLERVLKLNKMFDEINLKK